MKKDPIPYSQEDPELIEYCQVAFDSRPGTIIVPFLVMPSKLEDPVSIASASEGVDGAVVSMVIAPRLASEEVLPA